MGIFKIWGEKDIVRDVEDFSGTVDYSHVESYVGDDELTAPDLSRPVRNIFENQNWIYQYLESVADMHEDSSGIYRNSLENAFKVDSSADFLTLAVAGSFETTTLAFQSGIILSGLNNQYITINDGNDNAYYIWFNYNSLGSDPIPGGTAIPIAIGAADTVDDVILTMVTALNAVAPAYTIFNATANYVTNTVTVITTILGNVTDSTQGTVDTGDILVTPISGSATYKNYVRIPPGVARVGDTIFASIPQTWIAERQLERILGLETDEGSPEYVTIVYDYTNDKYQARIYTKNPSTGVVSYDEFGTVSNIVTVNSDNTADALNSLYFNLYDGNDNQYYVWYDSDDTGTDPTVAGATGIEVNISNGDSIDTVVASTVNAINAITGFVATANLVSNTVTITTDPLGRFQTNASDGDTSFGFSTSDGSYDTGIELIHAIFQNTKFTTTLYNALGGYNYERITLEPAIEVTATGVGVVRYLYIDENTFEFTWNASAGTGDDLALFTVDFDATTSSITINTLTDTRTFFQRNVDYNQSLYFNVPRTLSGEAGDPGTEDIGGVSFDWAKVTNQDVTLTVLRDNGGGSDDSSYIMWDESEGHFATNRDFFATENLVPVPRGNNQISATNTINENIDTLDAAIGGTITPAVRSNNPLIDTNTLNTNLSALDAAIGITPVPVTTRTNNPIVGSNTVVENLEALDAAVGVDVTPQSRTNNPLVVDTSVSTKLDTLDAAIGANMTAPVTREAAFLLIQDTSVNAKISKLDAAIGASPGNSSRSNYQVLNANSSNANISALDAAIGGNVSPETRPNNNPILVSNTVHANINALDAAIGADGQLSGTYVNTNNTIYQNLSAIDAGIVGLVDGQDAGSTTAGFLNYNGNSRPSTEGRLYGSTADPNGTTRLNYNGYFYATRFYSTSTREAKDNITDFSGSALNILNNTSIKSYNYKGDHQQTIGFIAEDTDPLLSTEKQTNFDMTNTIGVLIKAVQELSDEVKELKGAIA